MLAALRDRHPELALAITSTVPRERVALDLPGPFELRAGDYEPGTVQRNCFEIDRVATREAYLRFATERPARLEAERAFLRAWRADAVLADVPALAVRAAGELGLPAVALANFTWDWILAPLLAGGDAAHVPGLLAEDYAWGTLQLLYPFGPDRSPFPRRAPLELVSRRARLEPDEVHRRLGWEAAGPPTVLVCPGGWEPEGWRPIVVAGCRDLRFVTVGDLPVSADAPLRALPHALPHGLGFPDLVAAADVVLAKPGYGIASECAAHATPLVSIERPDFAETPFVVSGLRRYVAVEEVGLAAFFAGHWEPALRAALAGPPGSARVPGDATQRAAARVAEALGLAPPA